MTSVPDDYVAPAHFATLALQHTNVKLSWDADDGDRKRTLGKRVTKDELRDDDFKVLVKPTAVACVLARGHRAGRGAAGMIYSPFEIESLRFTMLFQG